jgi:hypothetical protein
LQKQTPLLGKIPAKKTPPHVQVVPFKEEEETTYITDAVMLDFSCAKAYLLVPLLSLLTIGVFSVNLYWKVEARKKYMYSEVTDLKEAKYLYVTSLDKNREIVPIKDYSQVSESIVKQHGKGQGLL